MRAAGWETLKPTPTASHTIQQYWPGKCTQDGVYMACARLLLFETPERREELLSLQPPKSRRALEARMALLQSSVLATIG